MKGNITQRGKLPKGIRERSKGHYAIIIETKDRLTGKRKPRWHSFAGSLRGAIIERARLITALEAGTYVEPSKETLARFFETWLDDIKSKVAPRTHERWAELATKNINPLLGNVPLTKLRAEQISAAYTKALESGRVDGSGGLSPQTVKHMHRVLKQALDQAVRWNRIALNPAAAVVPPKVEDVKVSVLDAAQTAQLIDLFRPTRMFIPVLLGVLTGMRRGEIVALRWSSVDLDRGMIAVEASTEETKSGVRRKETKSGRGRAVDMPSLLVEELRRHRVEQAEELLRLGIRLTDQHHVVANAEGVPLRPHSLTTAFSRRIAGSGLPEHITLHTTRHIHASELLVNGVHPKVVQERLGHSTIGITLDTYSHLLPTMQSDAASRVDAAMRAALKNGR